MLATGLTALIPGLAIGYVYRFQPIAMGVRFPPLWQRLHETFPVTLLMLLRIDRIGITFGFGRSLAGVGASRNRQSQPKKTEESKTTHSVQTCCWASIETVSVQRKQRAGPQNPWHPARFLQHDHCH